MILTTSVPFIGSWINPKYRTNQERNMKQQTTNIKQTNKNKKHTNKQLGKIITTRVFQEIQCSASRLPITIQSLTLANDRFGKMSVFGSLYLDVFGLKLVKAETFQLRTFAMIRPLDLCRGSRRYQVLWVIHLSCHFQ